MRRWLTLCFLERKLPIPCIFRTWIYVKDFPPLRVIRREPEPSQVIRRPGREERARQYRAMLDSEPGLTRAALARRLGVSRAWVTKILAGTNIGVSQ